MVEVPARVGRARGGSAKAIRQRVAELISIRNKREAQLQSVEPCVAEHPDPEGAESFFGVLPFPDVDWQLLQEEQFRGLPETLGFEASHEPARKLLKVKVVLTQELLLRASVPACLHGFRWCPPTGHRKQGCRREQQVWQADLSSKPTPPAQTGPQRPESGW